MRIQRLGHNRMTTDPSMPAAKREKTEGILALATLAQRWGLVREDTSRIGVGDAAVLTPRTPIMMRPVAAPRRT